MNKSRLEQLFNFLEENPEDPFIIYAIATEYLKTNIDKAREFYEILLSKHENYTGTYYHAAKLYAETGQADLAEKTYKKGMEIALKNKDLKALNELRNAYNEFMNQDEDD